MSLTQLERFDTLKARHPHLALDFVGWFCGTAARAERDPTHRPTVAAEVERFLAHYEQITTPV